MSNYYLFTNYFLYFLNSRWNIVHNSGFSQNIVVRTYRTAVPAIIIIHTTIHTI